MHNFSFAVLQTNGFSVSEEQTPVFRKFLDAQKIRVAAAMRNKDVASRRPFFWIAENGRFVRSAGVDRGSTKELQLDASFVPAKRLDIDGSVLPFKEDQVVIDVGHSSSHDTRVCCIPVSEQKWLMSTRLHR